MNTRVQVGITSLFGTGLLIGALSCSSGSQSDKIPGTSQPTLSGLSSAASLEVIAVSSSLNASTQYALTPSDLAELQSAGIIDSNDAAALQPFIKN